MSPEPQGLLVLAARTNRKGVTIGFDIVRAVEHNDVELAPAALPEGDHYRVVAASGVERYRTTYRLVQDVERV